MPQAMLGRTFGQLCDTRRNNFDFLRFFFASLVILTHAYSLVTPSQEAREPLAVLTNGKISFGSLAVDFFFAISGFLITQSWVRTDRAADYLKKRILRVYPGWTVALLFCVFVVAPLLRPGHGLALREKDTYSFLSQLLLHNTGVLKVLPGIGLPNGSTWTIPFEIMCYLLVAVLGLLGWLRRPLLVAALGVLLLAALNLPALRLLPMSWPPFGSHPLPYIGWMWPLPQFVAYFLSGALFFLFRDRVPHSPWLFAASVLLVILTLGRLPLAGLLFVVLPTAGFYALFYLAFLPLGPLHAWAKHGDLSYGVYLYAYPIERLLVAGQSHGYRLSPATLFLSAWALACLAAALSWRLVERPFLRLKPPSARPPMEQTGAPAVAAEGA